MQVELFTFASGIRGCRKLDQLTWKSPLHQCLRATVPCKSSSPVNPFSGCDLLWIQDFNWAGAHQGFKYVSICKHHPLKKNNNIIIIKNASEHQHHWVTTASLALLGSDHRPHTAFKENRSLLLCIAQALKYSTIKITFYTIYMCCQPIKELSLLFPNKRIFF